MVNEIIQRAGSVGCKEVVIGMPHRGRLNLLVNIMGKNPADLFGEFEGKSIHKKGSGDVKVSPRLLFKRDDSRWRSSLGIGV